MRRFVERAGREHHHIIQPEILPFHFAQRGNFGRYFDTEQANGHAVANTDAERFGDFGVKADEGRAVIVRSPPFALDQLAALGNCGAIGKPAVAVQHPCAFGQFFQLVDALAAIFDDRAAQRRDQVDDALGVGLPDHLREPRDAIARNIEHEEARRTFGDAVFDFVADAGLDRSECNEQGQPQTQCDDQRRCLRAGAVEIGEREARERGFRSGKVNEDEAQTPCNPGQKQKQPERRADEAKRE